MSLTCIHGVRVILHKIVLARKINLVNLFQLDQLGSQESELVRTKLCQRPFDLSNKNFRTNLFAPTSISFRDISVLLFWFDWKRGNRRTDATVGGDDDDDRDDDEIFRKGIFIVSGKNPSSLRHSITGVSVDPSRPDQIRREWSQPCFLLVSDWSLESVVNRF